MGLPNQNKGNVKTKWLNLMLHFSGVINKYKLKVIETTGPKVILYGLFVLFLEIINIIIALPAYAFISSKEFAASDKRAIGVYRLRRIMSLSAIFGIIMVIVISIMVGFFGLVIFPGTSHASVASWDFNTPLAYHYDSTKIQIIDGTAIFKATPTAVEIPNTQLPNSNQIPNPNDQNTNTVTPTPVPEPAPVSVPEPTPTPTPIPTPELTPAPTPVTPPAPSAPLLFNNLLGVETAHAETNSCSAMLTTITPLVVTPFVKWDGFSETANKNGGEIQYALSSDGGLTWLYWNNAWVDAGSENGNTASEINSHISTFPITLSQAGAGTLMFRAKFTSDCTQDVSLLSLTADYQDHPTQIISFTPQTPTQTTTVLTSESAPTVVAVDNAVLTTTQISTVSNTQTEIPVVQSTVTTQVTNTTSLNTGTEVATPSTTSQTPSVNTNTEVAPTTNTSLNTNVAIPIAFSVHTVIKTTGTSGHELYSIPGLFSLAEGPDNGLVVKVTGTDLQVATLTYGGSGSQAHVAVGDHIIVIVYDGSKLSLYVDGAATATIDAPIVIAPPANVSTSLGCVSAGVVLQALSLAQINANYLECQNRAPSLVITQAIKKSDDNFIDITYKAIDANNDLVSLPVYEYSKTGVFAGEQKTMTASIQDQNHDGTNGIAATTLGINHTFVWDASADLPNYAGNIFVRLRANDGLASGQDAIFSPVYVNTKVPVITSFEGSQLAQDDVVRLSYVLSEDNGPATMAFEVSHDNGVHWVIPAEYTSDAPGTLAHPAPGETGLHVIIWNAQKDFPNFEGNIKARISATDTYGSDTSQIIIPIDTRAPVGLSNFSGVESNTKQILWHWAPADDTNFTKYIVAYGTSGDDVKNESGSVSLWGPLRDSDLAIGGTDRTIVTGLLPDTLYYAKITAYDNYGHKSVSSVASFKTQSEVITVSGSTQITTPSTPNVTPIAPEIVPTPNQNLPQAEILGGVTVGEVLPDTSTLAPVAPSGGFAISIENNSTATESKNVTLSLHGGNAHLMLISNKSDLSDASIEDYKSSMSWDLCASLTTCESGTHTVYAKFYTIFGVASVRVSDSITLNVPVSQSTSVVENKGSVTSGTSNVTSETAITGQVELNVEPLSTENINISANAGGETSVNSNTQINVGSGSVAAPVGGGGGGSGPVISIINNGFSITTQNQPSPGSFGGGGAPISNSVPANSSGGSASGGSNETVPSSFIPTNNSVLQNSPELNVLAQSRESGVLAKPSVTIVKKSFTGQTINFEGTGIPNAKVALFIHSDQVVVYTTDADKTGKWSFAHSQDSIELAPGEHTVFAVTYDPGSKVKSKPSVVGTFEVKKNSAALILAYTNWPTTLLTLLVLMFGTIYLYSLKKKLLVN